MSLCRICNGHLKEPFLVKEMRHGFRTEFKYAECMDCNSLQIITIPEDLPSYYPSSYYSYAKMEVKKHSFLKAKVKKLYADLYIKGKKGFLFKFLKKRFGAGPLWIFDTVPDISRSSKILDVGTGGGRLLLSFASYGFSNLSGIDPFLPSEINYSNGLTIYKKDITQLNEKFDVILFNHVFEHVINLDATIDAAFKNLNDNGTLIINIPVANNAVYKKYKENWVALDAPRHLHLFSVEAFESYIKKHGFYVNKKSHISNSFSYLGSEQYKNDIALEDDNSFKNDFEKSIFTEADKKQFEKLAENDNLNEESDVVIFYLKKQNS
jgi:SAM-dependent methyltransferase